MVAFQDQAPAVGVASQMWSFDRLHPDRIANRQEILRILERVRRDSIELVRGMNRRIDAETARIERIDRGRIELRTLNFEFDRRPALFLSFELNGQPHFFSAKLITKDKNGRAFVELPTVLYMAERRDHTRRAPEATDSHSVTLSVGDRVLARAEVADISAEGIGLLVSNREADLLTDQVGLSFVDGSRAGARVHGEIRRRTPLEEPKGWTRIGLGLSETRHGGSIRIESLESVRPKSIRKSTQQRWKVLSAGVQLATNRLRERVFKTPAVLPHVRVLQYKNDDGEPIRAIIDSWGETRGATAVVIPPAWGRTKESLMPLAACIVSAFEKAREPVVVVRFDGIRKRGESHNDPECLTANADHHHFTFSQGFRDIVTTLDFLERDREFGPRSNVLVSFSAAAIESRRAVALDHRIDGWISVVGASDLQSMMRVISGGVDYALGMERGVRFGMQEILGIEVDMDHAGLDAFTHELVYLEDARRDMGRIQVPVTWIHGRYDAWMNSSRALDALSRGDTSQRRFIEVPTGHMLKTSSEALETFQLVVAEIGRMSLGRSIEPELPDLARLELIRRSERGRLSKARPDLHSFWKDYLLGRDESLGIELMTSITPYRDMMRAQVAALALDGDEVVADLGSGTGAFLTHLIDFEAILPRRVVEVDYVRPALRRARARLDERSASVRVNTEFVECDFELNGSSTVALATASIDAVIAALLISYIADPLGLLSEIHRVLRPGGRLVTSCLRRDADMSRLYRDGVEELREGRAERLLGPENQLRIDELARGYLNQASRLLDLEETGTFRFWDPPELIELVQRAGFVDIESERALGSPPQAVIVSARRP